MPQQYWYPSYYSNTSATTNTYQIIQPTWTTSNCTITQGNYWYPQNASYQTTAVSTDSIWQTWIVGQGTMTAVGSHGTFRQETPEEMEAHRERREQEQRERVAARARARTLLEGFLDEEQKAELERHGRFHVRGSRGRRYCIRAEGQSGNVDLLKEDGSLQARLCCHPRGYVPDGDAWLMQMIEIRHDEDHFLRTANVHRGVLPVAA